MKTTTSQKTKTLTMRGCNWTLAVGETIVNPSRRNGWTGRVVRHLGTKHTIRPCGADGRMGRESAQRVVVEIV